MDLAKQIGDSRPVFAFDDGAVLRGTPLAFSSVESVAAACLPGVVDIAQQYGGKEEVAMDRKEETGGEEMRIALGGWSYGGVVAVEVAKQLKQRYPHLRVSLLVVIDSPLRPALGDKAPHSIADSGSQASPAARQHFEACTVLLAAYHSRPVELEAALACPVLCLLPDASSDSYDRKALAEVTSTTHTQVKVVPGTHWTIVYGDSSAKVAALIEDHFNSHTLKK